jgi:predicted Zn-dependent protease
MIGLSFLTAGNIIVTRKSSAMANPKIEQFKKILQLDPKDETLWFGLGKAYMSDKNWGAAIPALEQCIQVRPNYSAAYFALAQSLQQQEQFEKCRSVCVEGIAVATTNGDLLVIKNLEELSHSLPS